VRRIKLGVRQFLAYHHRYRLLGLSQKEPDNIGTRNVLDCDQSYYSSRIVFSHTGLPIEFGQTGISAIRSADLENPIVEPNMKCIGRPLADIWPFEIFPNVRSSVAGRFSIYTSS